MKNNNLIYLQTWHYDGFQLEVPIESIQREMLSDIHLVNRANGNKVTALLHFTNGTIKQLDSQLINAHCYTVCPTLGEKKHLVTQLISKPFIGKCFPAGQTIYREQLPNKKDRMERGDLFIHYFECALSAVYKQLCQENPTITIFKFKHCPVISAMASKKTNPVRRISLFTRKK